MKQKIPTVILIFLAFLTTLPAGAEPFPGGNFSGMRSINTAIVEQVIDPHTIRLEDKKVIRLSGIEYPDFNPNMPGPLSITALKILKDMLEGKKVNVYQSKNADWGRTNRMGQQLAHLEILEGGAWVQGTILSLGLARVMTDARNPEMAAQMYALEETARSGKAGLWAMDRYKILTPDEAADYTGGVGIVEGRVHSTAMRQNRVYINFGADWRNDFTLSIQPENRRAFFDRNIDPLKWNGKTIRARGWIGSYNGPYIELDHPEQIEILADPK